MQGRQANVPSFAKLVGVSLAGDVDAMREALRKSKGRGISAISLFLRRTAKTPHIKLMLIAQVAAKEEFLGIKNTTQDDQLAPNGCRCGCMVSWI